MTRIDEQLMRMALGPFTAEDLQRVCDVSDADLLMDGSVQTLVMGRVLY
jgi:hypothetical protein